MKRAMAVLLALACAALMTSTASAGPWLRTHKNYQQVARPALNSGRLSRMHLNRQFRTQSAYRARQSASAQRSQTAALRARLRGRLVQRYQPAPGSGAHAVRGRTDRTTTRTRSTNAALRARLRSRLVQRYQPAPGSRTPAAHHHRSQAAAPGHSAAASRRMHGKQHCAPGSAGCGRGAHHARPAISSQRRSRTPAFLQRAGNKNLQCKNGDDCAR